MWRLMDGRILRAIIYCRTNRRSRVEHCWAYCTRQGYTVVAAIFDTNGGWPLVMALVRAEQVDVVVVPNLDEPPPDRRPRLEVAA
jgi:hypothetical protein